jgi:HK97 family phage prohead protease
METKFFSVDVMGKPKPGTFKARVCTFGQVDKGGDVVHRGAFAASLTKRRAANRAWPVIFDHDGSDPLMVVGRVSPHDSQEDDIGLVVTGTLNLDEERGRKVHEELKRGTLEWSFGCLVQKAQPRQQGGRDLLVLDLFEVSPTIIGKGDTETLYVAHADRARPGSLSVDELLAPYRARLAVWMARRGHA